MIGGVWLGVVDVKICKVVLCNVVCAHGALSTVNF